MANLEQWGDDDGLVASINIIPFVDIVLVLLVIFMLTSSTISRASLKVDLPKAASAGSRVGSTVNLAFSREGQLWLNGQPSPWPEAAAFIRREAANNPELQAVIAADEAVEYGKVVELIDLVKASGVATFALDVSRKAASDPTTSAAATP